MLKLVNGTPVEKRTNVKAETQLVNDAFWSSLKRPDWQRNVKENRAVIELAEQYRNKTMTMHQGSIVVGIVDGEKYLVDGQHRRLAQEIAGVEEMYAVVEYHWCQDMEELSKLWDLKNRQINKTKSNDILKSKENRSTVLQIIRAKTNGRVGYDSNGLSMSQVIRMWAGTGSPIPTTTGGIPAERVIEFMKDEDAYQLADFINACHSAWGSTKEVLPLWRTPNLITCAWLYRRLLIDKTSTSRTSAFTRALFVKCLMSLGADSTYVSWLVGRNWVPNQRSQVYLRVKRLFAARYKAETGTQPQLPQPNWGD